MSEKINPWLEEKVKGMKSPQISIVVEVEPKTIGLVLTTLRGIPGITRIGSVSKTPHRSFIPVTVKEPAIIESITRIPGVIEIHYETPRYIRSINPFVKLKILDPILGEIMISKIEIPEFKPILPIPFLQQGMKDENIEIIPTSTTKNIVVDTPTTLTGKGVKVAVIDTGATPIHPQLFLKSVKTMTTVPEIPFADFMGHGNWCITCVGGNKQNTRFGSVEGIAPKADLISIKCLTMAGFGTTSSVLKAMEMAIKSGAKIISMSLGGPLQGGVEHDPNCKFIEDYKDSGIIFVAAAGNEGPNDWTIGSPGASPHVITVGSYSPLYNDLSVFSSRGPNADWYELNKSMWSEDYAKYGEDLIKPDCIAPGGGPVKKEQEPIDIILSGVTGWFDGYYDKILDGYEAMRGTSMATPNVSGLFALLAEANPNITTNLIKRNLRTSHKSNDYGYGLITLSRF